MVQDNLFGSWLGNIIDTNTYVYMVTVVGGKIDLRNCEKRMGWRVMVDNMVMSISPPGPRISFEERF